MSRGRRTAETVRLTGGTAVYGICGMAGVGKTALSVHLGHRFADRFPDGQLFADLHAHGSGGPLAPEVALDSLLRQLGVDGAGSPSGWTSVPRSGDRCWWGAPRWWCSTMPPTPPRSGRCSPRSPDRTASPGRIPRSARSPTCAVTCRSPCASPPPGSATVRCGLRRTWQGCCATSTAGCPS